MRTPLRTGLAAPVIVAAACLCLSAVPGAVRAGDGRQADRAAAAPSSADDAWQAAGNLFARGRYAEAAEGYAAFADGFAKDPRAPEARFRSGEALFRAGRLDEALERFRKLRGDARAALREANVLYLAGRPDEAAARLREMLARERLPASLEGPARYFLARSLLSLGRTDEARKVIEEAPKSLKGAPGACLKLALGDVEAAAYLAGRKKGAGDAGRIEAALSAYRGALEKDTGGRLAPEILFGIGELLRRSGRAKEAIEYYRRVAEDHASSPVAPYARLGLSWAALGQGDFDAAARGAKRSRQKAREDDLTAESRYAEGTAHLAAKRYAEAAGALAPLLEAPGAPVPRDRLLGRLAWAALASGKKEIAAKAARALLELAPAPERASEAEFVAGEVELGSGRPAKALAHFDAAARLEGPIRALAAYRRGAALDAAGDVKGAAKAYDEFVRAHSSHRLAAGARALAARNWLSAGDAERAAERFGEARRALAGTPGEPEALWGAALAEYMRGNVDAFAGHSKEIVERHGGSPRAAEAAYWLGWSSLKKNKLKEAAERFRDAAARATKLGKKELAAAAMLESASALERSGDGKGALSRARALVSGPLASHAPVETSLWVAEALREAGEADEAEKVLDAALARAGEGEGRARILYARGELARLEGRHERAIEFFGRAVSAKPARELHAAAMLGKARCLLALGRPHEAEVVLRNLVDRTAGWAKAAAYVELGDLSLARATRAEGESRRRLAVRAARDFMLVVVLYEPREKGEGARLSARALLGAARAYVLVGRYAAARDKLEELIAQPLLSAAPDGKETPEARQARKLLKSVGLKAYEAERTDAPGTTKDRTNRDGQD